MDGLEIAEGPSGEGADDDWAELHGGGATALPELPEDAPSIYLSHGGADEEATQVLSRHLNGVGCRAVVLEDVHDEAGRKDREKAIRANLPGSAALVVVWSESAADSHWCAFEATLAKALAKPLFVICIDDTELPAVIADVPLFPWKGALHALSDALQAAGLIEGDTAGLSGAWLAAVAPGDGESVIMEAPREQPIEEVSFEAPEEVDGSEDAEVEDFAPLQSVADEPAPIEEPEHAEPLPPLEGPPYPGLAGFTEEDGGVFFGREGDIVDVVTAVGELCRGPGPRVLLLVGPSGAGKASLLRAGVAPRLRKSDKYAVPPVLSGRESPFYELAESLDAALEAAGHRPGADTRAELEGRGAGALFAIIEKLRGEGHVVLAIDRLEGLLARRQSGHKFFSMLRAALEGDRSPVTLVGTVRSDFLGELLEVPALRSVRPACLSVGPLSAEGIAQAVLGPAGRAECQVDSALASALVSEARGADALPSLAVALREVHAIDGARGSLRNYSFANRLGSLRHSIERVAEAALEGVEDAAVRGVRASLLMMVTVDGEGRTTLKQVPRTKLSPAASDTIEALLACGVLQTSGESETARLTLAHEALVTRWPRLREWIEEERDLVRWKGRLERARTAWCDAD